MRKYIELKTGHGHSGPASIARVRMSPSGRTVYFNGKALKRGLGVSGNCFDLERPLDSRNGRARRGSGGT